MYVVKVISILIWVLLQEAVSQYDSPLLVGTIVLIDSAVSREKCQPPATLSPERGMIRSKQDPAFDNKSYVNQANCLYVIVAGEGMRATFKFRKFGLEPSTDCKYDNLVIRDGAFGYSRIIGIYCGEDKSVPAYLHTTGRYGYVEFKSDKEVSGLGFELEVIFSKISPTNLNRKECTIELKEEERLVSSKELYNFQPISEGLPYDCTWIIKKPDRNDNIKIYFDFELLNLNKPNDCEINRFEFYEKGTHSSEQIKSLCTDHFKGPFETKEDFMYVRYVSQANVKSDFRFWYTLVRIGEQCGYGEYQCERAICLNRTADCVSRFKQGLECNTAFNKLQCAKRLALPPPPNTVYYLFAMVAALMFSILCIVAICRVRLSHKTHKQRRMLEYENQQNGTHNMYVQGAGPNIRFNETVMVSSHDRRQGDGNEWSCGQVLIDERDSNQGGGVDLIDGCDDTNCSNWEPATQIILPPPPPSLTSKERPHQPMSILKTSSQPRHYEHASLLGLPSDAVLGRRRSSTSMPWVEKFHISDAIGTRPDYQHKQQASPHHQQQPHYHQQDQLIRSLSPSPFREGYVNNPLRPSQHYIPLSIGQSHDSIGPGNQHYRSTTNPESEHVYSVPHLRQQSPAHSLDSTCTEPTNRAQGPPKLVISRYQSPHLMSSSERIDELDSQL